MILWEQKKVNTILLANNDTLLSLIASPGNRDNFNRSRLRKSVWMVWRLQTSLNYSIKREDGRAVPLAYLSCYTEFIGGLLLALDLFVRPTTMAVVINMAVATITMLPGSFFGSSGPGASYLFINYKITNFEH